MGSLRIIMLVPFLIVTHDVKAATYQAQMAACNSHVQAMIVGRDWTGTCTDQPASLRVKECINTPGETSCNVFSQYWYYDQTVCQSPLVIQPDHSCACPAGQTLVNGQCVNPCQAGTTKQLSASQNGADGNLLINIGSGPTVADGGCQYQCPNTSVDGLTYYNASDTWNTYMCTATGHAAQTTDKTSATIPADASKIEQPTAPTDETQPYCHKLTDGTEVCAGGTVEAGCMMVNGVKSCPEKDTIDGQTTKPTDEKNCQRSNGVTLCAAEPADADFCGEVNGVTKCYTTKTKVTSNTTRTTDPGTGYETETTTETDNVQGSTPKVTTVVKDSSGKEIGRVVSGGEGNTTEGDSAILSEISRNTGRTANATEAIKDMLGDGGQFSGQGPNGDPNELYTPTDKTMQSIYSDFLNDIQTQPLYQAVQTAFVASFTSCGCPVFETGNISLMGANFNFRFDQFCSETFNDLILPTVQAVIGILAALVAIKFAFL